jgi:hypothetical protein
LRGTFPPEVGFRKHCCGTVFFTVPFPVPTFDKLRFQFQLFDQYRQFYTVSARTFVIPFYYGSNFRSKTVINYGSGSAKVRN